MTYELWDLKTGNCVDASDDATTILALVREYLEDEGPSYIVDLGYRALDVGGKTVMPVTEMEMVTFALFADPEGHVVGIAKGQ